MTAETPSELTDDDSGKWRVTTTSGSVYRLDLDTKTVERVGGEPRPPAAPADTSPPLRSIVALRVGQPRRWWMRNLTGGYTAPSSSGNGRRRSSRSNEMNAPLPGAATRKRRYWSSEISRLLQ